LIAAVAIDPSAITDPVAPGQAAVAPAPAIVDLASQEKALEAPLVAPPPEKPEPAPGPRSALAWFGGTGAHGEISHGFGPRSITLRGGSIFGEAGLALGAPWKPAIRLAALLAKSPEVLPEETSGAGAATFTLLAGRLSFCPLEFSPHPRFRIRPCGDLEVGQLTGQGRPVDNGSVKDLRSGTMTRIAVGETVQGRIRLFSQVWLEWEAAAREPLLRQNFVFYKPDVAVASVSPVELAGALGLGVHFP
jgi:hypothetical protein